MGIKQNTWFIQSNSDWPMPKATDPGLQSPMDHPQPYDDVFLKSLEEDDNEEAVDTNRWVTNFRNLRRREERLRLTKRVKADEAWDKYNGIYDFSDKEDWQSKKIVPKVFITVERLASVICRILEQSTDWFDIQALDEKGQVFYNLVKRLIKFFLDHDSVNFGKIFRQVVKAGLLWANMYVMVVWEQDGCIVYAEDSPLDDDSPVKDSPFMEILVGKPESGADADSRIAGNVILPGKKMPRLRIQMLNPDYVYLDSSGRNRFKIWEVKTTKGEALREAKTREWDMAAVERALAKPTPAEDTTDVMVGFHETRDAQKQERVPDYKHFQTTKISNYFGDFYDEDTGELIAENVYFVVMNDTEIVYGPVDNPNWDSEDPIVAAPMIEVPFSPYGKSPLTENMDMFDLWNEFLNLMVDYFQSILFGMKEVDVDLLEDAEDDLSSGFYPGKYLRTSKGGQATPAITNIPFSDVPAGFWQFMQIFQKEVSDNTLLTDTMAGQPKTRGRTTAMEFNRRASEAGSMIDFVFDSLQDNLLGPLIRKTFHCLLQYMPQKMWKAWVETHKADIEPKDPKLKEQWDAIYDEVKEWTPSERWKNLAGFFRFRVRVYSALGDRQMEIEKGTFMLQTISQVPGAAGYLRYDKLLRYMVRAFGWDPEEIISPEQLPLPTIAAMPGAETVVPNLMSQFGGMGGQPEGFPMGTPQPGGQGKPNLGAAQSISTSPPFAPDTGGIGMPP